MERIPQSKTLGRSKTHLLALDRLGTHKTSECVAGVLSSKEDEQGKKSLRERIAGKKSRESAPRVRRAEKKKP